MSELRSIEKLNLGIEIAALGIGEVDYIADTITLDTRAASFFELPAGKPVSRNDLHDRIHPDDKPGVEHQVDCLLSPDTKGFISVVHRVINSDGTVRWLNARKQVTFEGQFENGNPRPVTGLVAIQDITKFKAAEARIQFLMGEVAHRSKNMLSVVQGIARLTERNSAPANFMTDFTARLTALSSNQAILIDDKWTRMDLCCLAKSQMAPYTLEGENRVTFSGPHVVLTEKSAQGIGMALHELATNAVKYGALSNTTGTVQIEWNLDGEADKTFELTWRERGGPPVSTPTRKGFGEKVIRQMAATSVSGSVSLDYEPAGVRWRLAAPLRSIAV